MKNIFLLTVLLILTAPSLFSQNTKDLYMPREYKMAYNKETRSHDGIPGKNYFQNKTDYNIKAEFFPESKMLVGKEVVTFYNNSPDSLSWVYINLYQNRFKKGESRDSYVDEQNIHSGVEISLIKINGTEVDLKSLNYYSTILYFPVPNTIIPSSKTKIEIEWSQLMPVTGLYRIGTYKKNNFFIGYWYPKINVYDDIVGWNVFGHKGKSEFYHDYGDFEVDITVPHDYNVWSSGLLQNAEEIFCEKYIQRIKEASLSEKVINIIGKEDRLTNKITKDADKHTWKFKAADLSDFAFAVSNQYLWSATSVKVGNRRVFVSGVYDKDAVNFHLATDISRRSIDYFSTVSPGINYPFEQFTAFQGEKNGMEFPAIINDQEESSEFGTMLLTTHELAHTYFPFYVGINEQEYSWMDEGIVSIIGISALAEFTGMNESAILKMAGDKYKAESAKLAIDIPMMVGTHEAGDFTYGFITYVRPIVAFSLLFDYMGRDKFYQAIRLFAENWKGKHPIPYDLFHSFNKVAEEDLGWFWKPWFFELGYADIGVGEVELSDKNATINIENLGSFPIPINLLIKFKDGTEIVVKKKMDVWKSDAKSCSIKINRCDIKEIILNKDTPEAFYGNNIKKF